MRRRYLFWSLALLLCLSLALLAAPEQRPKIETMPNSVIQPPAKALAACTMIKHNGTAASFSSGYQAGMGTYTYFDPAVQCGGAPYPFQITAFSFTLYDPGGYTWPVVVDIVVYDVQTGGDKCLGPGAELCRYTYTVDQATFGYPNVGTVTLPDFCCVNGPVFIGLEYGGGSQGSTPSVLFDNNQAPDTCDNWMFYIDGNYYEWYDYWAAPVPGYPIFWVDGETQSANCAQPCVWNPGDPYKMHFPQLPNPAGWDVNATYPQVLAEDFQCTETGPITDIHFWGSWRDGIEGTISSFILSIHADIPADQSPTGYSMPGAVLAELQIPIDRVTIVPFDSPTPEGWYDPASNDIRPNNHQAYFQYNICLDPSEYFTQDSGTIYWLNISANVDNPDLRWGWKSTLDHFNDDAVYQPPGATGWIDIWEPSEQLSGSWFISFDPNGTPIQSGGDPAYGLGWYFYEPTNWWNVWFYDHQFIPENRKVGYLEFDAQPLDPTQGMFVEVAVNWSTDQWSIDQPPTDSSPPLPGTDETKYIGRQILFSSDVADGHYGPFPFLIKDYNPEWVSVDVRGFNVDLRNGIIMHECQPSLDLAFVITGGGTQEQPEACCLPDGSCQDLLPTVCQSIGGTPQGPGTVCSAAQEACCLPDGSCTMADPLCCQNELGGTPMGPGSSCAAAPEACCMADGTCQMLDPLCCQSLGGTPQGPGSQCTTFEACCLPNGQCQMLDPLCCQSLGGTPQGPGSTCSVQTQACCFPDGSCQNLDPLCCDDLGGTPQGPGTVCLGDADGDGYDDACKKQLEACCLTDGTCQVLTPADCAAIGGTPSPFGSPICLGDADGDGFDDACVQREDLKWRQAPDLEPTGMDVDASCPGLLGECVVLADDFLCTQTGPITEIHIFGSWYEDILPGQPVDPGAVRFTLSIHRDVPAGIDLEWSHPGNMIWSHTFAAGEFTYRPYATGIQEGYFDPIQGNYQAIGDTTCWEYIFNISNDSQFVQMGTAANPVIYWLDVQAYPETPGSAFFGWKTSLDHWNDDAVWALGVEPIPPTTWNELRYPPAHPFATQSADLAFEIYSSVCDCLPGDANGDGVVNIGDAVYLVNFIFKGGPPPAPYALCSGDANCDCQVNIADAVYLINFIFKGGPPPCDCQTWLSICGPPLRK
jgi:hypothetical protein